MELEEQHVFSPYVSAQPLVAFAERLTFQIRRGKSISSTFVYEIRRGKSISVQMLAEDLKKKLWDFQEYTFLEIFRTSFICSPNKVKYFFLS